MTDTVKEQLSAFLDGELPEAETTLLLKRLERDDDLKGTLSRYSLIGAVMRSAGDMPAARHVAARVSAAVAREPRLGVPSRDRWLRPVAGLAVAASVALATVLLLPQWLGGTTQDEVLTAAVESPAGLALSAADGAATEVVPVVLASAGEPPATSYTTPPAPMAPAGNLPSTQLAAYLVAHSEYTLPLSRRSVVTIPPEEPANEEVRDDEQAAK